MLRVVGVLMEALRSERRLQTGAAQLLIKQNGLCLSSTSVRGGVLGLHLMTDALIVPQVSKGGFGFSFSPPFHLILFFGGNKSDQQNIFSIHATRRRREHQASGL